MNHLLRTKDIDYGALSLSYGRIRDYLDTLGIRIKPVVLQGEDKALYIAYDEAKKNKDFATSDQIRQQLIDRGLF